VSFASQLGGIVDTTQLNQDQKNHGNAVRTAEIANGTMAVKSVVGGVLMGLANLVPGISGGTMLLAAGVYPQFIEAVSDVTRLRFRFRSLLVLGCVVAAAGVSILLLAGPLKVLVVSHRWGMYSLFIGLTLGGIPVVWRLAKPATHSLIVCAVLSFLVMVGLALLQGYNVVGTGGSNYLTLLIAGLAGASAMILPGLSGGYLLLLLGQYLPILSAIDEFKEALKAGDVGGAMTPAVQVMLPVGIGVVLGVAVVGNLLQWLLNKHRKPTLGVLLGLLIGSVVGLFPFQAAVVPVPGQMIKAQLVTEENLSSFDQEDWPTAYFAPSPIQVAASLLLIATGFALTTGIAKIGGGKDSEPA
jgi:putative membrane protein